MKDYEFVHLDRRFRTLLHRAQEMRKKTLHYPTKKQLIKLHKIGKEILEKGLHAKCGDKEYARQLMQANEIPVEYWRKDKVKGDCTNED